jgi:hypothetical protein
MRENNVWSDSIRVMAPPTAINDIAFNKLKTYQCWPEISPRLYPNSEVNQWYVKPVVGHSSIGCRYIDEVEAAKLHEDKNLVVCEGLSKDALEYTVECYGQELMGARIREKTSGGFSVLTRIGVVTPGIKTIIRIIGSWPRNRYRAPMRS